MSKREKTLAEVDDRFQLKRGRPLEGANDDRRGEWESRKDRRRERERKRRRLTSRLILGLNAVSRCQVHTRWVRF